MAALDAEARENWYDPEWRAAQAAIMSTQIYEGFAHETILPLLAEVETVGLGDRITIEEVRGLEVFWVAVGGQIDASVLTEKVWELRRDTVGYHVYELSENMQSGFARNAAQLVNLAITQMDAAINKRLFGLYQAAIPSIASPYYITGAGLSLPALDTAITEVQDESLDDKVTIVGRRTMTNQIITELRDQNGFTPATNEQLLQGILGSYMGAEIVALKNYKDALGRAYIPGNELIVCSSNAAKVGFWGGLTTQEWDEQGGSYWHAYGRRSVGMALRKAAWVRRIVDTSRSAN
jgi:hypothetical protein